MATVFPLTKEAHAVDWILQAEFCLYVSIKDAHEHVVLFLRAHQSRHAPSTLSVQLLRALSLLLDSRILRVDCGGKLHVRNHVVVPTIDLHVVWPVLSCVLHAARHLRRLALHEAATASIENHVTSKGHPVDVLADLVSSAHSFNCVLHALLDSFDWLEHERERATGVARRVQAGDAKVVHFEHLIMLAGLRHCWDVILSASNDLDTREGFSDVYVTRRMI